MISTSIENLVEEICILEVGLILLVFGSLYFISVFPCGLVHILVEHFASCIIHILLRLLQGFEVCLFVEAFEGHYIVTIEICNF